MLNSAILSIRSYFALGLNKVTVIDVKTIHYQTCAETHPHYFLAQVSWISCSFDMT